MPKQVAGQRGPCAWIEGCSGQGRLRSYRNALGESVKHYYCNRHWRMMHNSEQREEMGVRMTQTLRATREAAEAVAGVSISPLELKDHDIFKSLQSHHERCARCKAVDEWISKESLAGRIKTAEDTRRVGEYCNANCCAIGIYLRERAGRLMAGLIT